MRKPSISLDRLRVVAPCTQDWNAMAGNDRVRFCGHCASSVYDISAITRSEAERLVAESAGRLCVRYRLDPGRPAENSPRLLATGRRASPFAAGVFAVALTTSGTPAQAAPQADAAGALAERGSTPRPQEPGGYATIGGLVRDPIGAVVPQATVVLTSAATGESVSTSSDEEGVYRFANVAAGTYELAVEAAGFQRALSTGMYLAGGDDRVHDVALEVGSMGALVIASAAYDLLTHPEERDARGAGDAEDPALLSAAAAGESAELKKALRQGAEADARNTFGDTALMLGVHDGKIVKALLTAGADVNARNEFGVTPLMYAVVEGDRRAVKLLIAAGADVNAADSSGRGPLIFASLDGDAEVVEALLKAGANATARDHLGKTALTYAEDEGNADVIRLLVSAGAEP